MDDTATERSDERQPGYTPDDQGWRRHRRLVDRVARRFARRLRGQVGVEDLSAAGYVRLVDSLARFDPQRGVPLSGYLQLRVKGAIIDALRAQDPLSRELRSFALACVRARRALSQRLLRAPDSDELAAELGCALDRYHVLRNRAEGARPRRLTRRLPATDEPPDVYAARIEERDLLSTAMQEIEPRLRMVITRIYFEDASLRELATSMNVSESRVCQLHVKALGLLRGLLDPLRSP